ncbi:MAG TPA: hypothetical protein VI731_11710 [Bacteroidia bacterium]|nr:hypothetical protein [Bacteroidia bacterium]
MNKASLIASAGALFLLTASFVLKGRDTSNIEGKSYKITVSDAKKAGKPGEMAECTIKGSKFRCNFFDKNAGADAIPIELTVDSTYMSHEDEDAEELLYVEFTGEVANKLEENVHVEAIIDGYDIEGHVELSKKGKVKKHWDFIGTQKVEKKKKKKE